MLTEKSNTVKDVKLLVLAGVQRTPVPLADHVLFLWVPFLAGSRSPGKCSF